MHKKFMRIFILFIFLLLILTTKNQATSDNFNIVIEDDANLLTTAEENSLREQMMALTEFGNVILKTTNTKTGYSKSLKYIQDYYYSKFQNKSGVAFYIDMNARQICACATGGLDKTITNGKCDTIMDNVYRYATKGEYYNCAKETFIQMNTLLNGGKIAESMKYICNAFVSAMLAMFASYGIYALTSRNRKATHNELIDECEVSLNYTPISVIQTGTHSVYSPPSSSDSFSGGGGSSGGSSGGGGGGFSGSGGSHGF